MRKNKFGAYTVFTFALFCMALLLFGKVVADRADMLPPAEYIYWEEVSSSDIGDADLWEELPDGSSEAFPKKEEAGTFKEQGGGIPDESQKTAPADPNRMVNLNTAKMDDLCSLDGIGEVLAGRIIEYRTQNGGFSTIEELQKVKGIGEKKFAAIKSRITV